MERDFPQPYNEIEKNAAGLKENATQFDEVESANGKSFIRKLEL